MRDAAYVIHPDFLPAQGSSRIVPDDAGSYDPHGTFIAGIIMAEANNGGAIKRGIAGIDQGCILWNYADRWSWWPFDGDNSDDIYDTVNAGVDVMNLSDADEDPTTGKALAYAYNSGVVLVAATGNNGGEALRYPASFDGVIGVGGVRDNFNHPTHSNYGTNVDLVAPDGGEGPDNRKLRSLTTPAGGLYAWDFGTSYACPHVVGAAALLLAGHPELSNDDLAAVLKLSARDIDPPGIDIVTGAGLVKIDSAFRILEPPNKLRQWVGTPTTYSVSSLTSFVMNIDAGSGVYLGYKHELRRTVNLQASYFNRAGLWPRGSASLGLKDSSGLYETHYSEIVSESPTSVTLRTYVYELWDLAGGYVGWVPCRPEDALVSYGVLGEEMLSTPTLYATVQNGHHRLSWSDGLDIESNWHVDRKEGNGSWQVDFAILPANSSSFTDSASELIGSELYEYRIYPSTPTQTGNNSNVVSLRAKPKAPSCISGYVVKMNILAAHPVEYCSACNTSECGGIGGPIEMLGGGGFGEELLDGEEMMQSIGDPPGCPSGCQKTNMLVVEWDEPENQVLSAIEGYRIARFDDAQAPFWTYGDLTTFLADTMCSELSPESFELGVITVDEYGDTSSRVVEVSLTTGSLDYCGGYGTPQEKLAVDADQADALPKSFALHQNHPNPFNAGTVIEFDLPVPSNVELEVFDVLGRRVAGLAQGVMPAGQHALVWDGRNSNGDPVASGIYFYRISADGFEHTRKMVVLK